MQKGFVIKQAAKDQLRRFRRYRAVENELLATGKSLVLAESIEAAHKNFKRVVSHAEGLWVDACTLFLGGRYPTALAISITCLEEVGKIGVAKIQLLEKAETHRKITVSTAPQAPRRGHPFYSHSQKLLLAVGAGVLHNGRLDRILGLEKVMEFLDRVEKGEIEPLRQSCLYSDVEGGHLFLPSELIGEKEAEFYVVLVGEVLAEVVGPSERRRLLACVQQFEKRIGHTH